MNKLIPRLSIFFIGLPAVLAFVFLNIFNHLPLHVLITAVCFFASNEMYDIYSKQVKLLPKPVIVGLSTVIPFIAGLYKVIQCFFEFPLPVSDEIITFTVIFALLFCLAAEVISAKTFEESNVRLSSSIFIVLYSGFLLTFVSRMTTFAKNGKNVSTQIIAVFLLMVFLCDSLAWFFGILFGKNNKGFIKASPNKSIAGFMGGFAGSVCAGILAHFVWPDVFYGSIIKVIILGIIMAFSSIIGDLVESIFKRSSGIKDSGHLVPGRGGVLDSIDSIVMSAPIYYLLLVIMFGPF